MQQEKFDLIVIGAGPGGYVAAIRGSQLGMKVAVVEKRKTLGGVCLNEGCIPSKALLDSSEHFAMARDKFSLHGIEIDPPRLNLSAMLARKDDVVKRLTDGVAYLFKKHKITVVYGTAQLKGSTDDGMHHLQVETDEALISLSTSKVLLATGSEPVSLPDIPFDGELVVSAREALAFDLVPGHLVIVGAGYIGLELGSVWRRLGAKVTFLEMLPVLLPAMDRQAADALQRALKKQGMEFRLGAKVNSLNKMERNRGVIKFTVGDEPGELECDRILVSVGRCPLIAGLGFTELGGKILDNGRVYVDQNYESSISGIYAIGDIIPGPMLAHKASEEAVVCVERMSGKSSKVNYDSIPGVVYTWPEGASAGKTEEQLKKENISYRSGKFNFIGNGRARAMDETDGFVKLLADAETDRILGVHIIGPRASDMIAEAVTVIGFNGTARELGAQIHAHPTLSEAMKEAALDLHKEAIHG